MTEPITPQQAAEMLRTTKLTFPGPSLPPLPPDGDHTLSMARTFSDGAARLSEALNADHEAALPTHTDLLELLRLLNEGVRDLEPGLCQTETRVEEMAARDELPPAPEGFDRELAVQDLRDALNGARIACRRLAYQLGCAYTTAAILSDASGDDTRRGGA